MAILEELVSEIRKIGFFEESGLTKLPIYEIGVETLPIVCADIIPVKDGKIGVIKRATGPEAGKLALIGGRVRKNQRVSDAISNHLKTDLAITKWNFHPINSEQRPFFVQQYLHKTSSNNELGYDPTKHAIAMTYLIEIEATPVPRKEADAFLWVDEEHIPDITAYNQGFVMKAALAVINKDQKNR